MDSNQNKAGAAGSSRTIPINDTTTDSKFTPKGHPKITISKNITNQRPFRYTNPINVTRTKAAAKEENACSQLTNHSILYNRRVNFQKNCNAKQDNPYWSKINDNSTKSCIANSVTAEKGRTTEKDKPYGSESTDDLYIASTDYSGISQDTSPIKKPSIHPRITYPSTMTKNTSEHSPHSAEFLNHTYLPSCSYAYRSNPRKQSYSKCNVYSTSYKTSKQQCFWMPYYKNYQLLGDSQLLRFSEQLLNFKNFVSYTGDYTKVRRIGYCVSGQKIWDLQYRLISNEYDVLKKVVLLVGTNDIIQGTSMKQMHEGYKSILSILKPMTDRIVILTVPPLPKFVLLQPAVNYNVLRFNEFLKNCADGEKVFVVDLAKQYISSDYIISLQYFEKTYNGNEARADLVHLNQEGFKLLKTLLDNHLEDNP